MSLPGRKDGVWVSDEIKDTPGRSLNEQGSDTEHGPCLEHGQRGYIGKRCKSKRARDWGN